MRWLVLLLALSALPAQAAVLAAARTLPAGTVITAADLRAVDGDRPGLSDPSQAIGLQTRITIQEGRPLQASLLQAPKLISRNQIHRLVFQRGALRIVTEARTLSDGAAGDVIRVMNLESRATLSATVQPDGSLMAVK
ncbi:flagellar basal body P-ring formation chaperone FlgA [Paracoccus benzoatiresistens]|uniref:Flagella basal body P-ring formation protein FlgA n=1 Tax=Paracoccus benzoatiresistens TaxID=2997341 RepID=A0ABT4J093_9RHOB|nr:flagellar basal body P-ring formation chaperone FlgA [Paracoccus sp. EF6]MCZ0960529.1 flagellar basal body P-ring formation chaperone FlgA [Paracoccus sp. EF6]